MLLHYSYKKKLHTTKMPNNKSYKVMPNNNEKETITRVLVMVLKSSLMVVLWSKRSKKNLIKNLKKSTLSSNLIKNL